MRERIFQPGDRVEFQSMTSEKLFRGIVDRGPLKQRSSAWVPLYMVTHDGEQKSRPVSANRLRASVTMIRRAGDAA